MGVGASQGAAHRGGVASRQVVGIYLKSTTECIFCLIPSKQCIGVSAPRNTTEGVRTGQVFHADIASRGQPWTVLSPPITSRSNPSKGTSGFAALRLAQYHTKKSKSNDWLTTAETNTAHIQRVLASVSALMRDVYGASRPVCMSCSGLQLSSASSQRVAVSYITSVLDIASITD